MRLLVDTNALSRFFAGDQRVLAAMMQAEQVNLSVFVLGELYAGFSGGSRERENRELLQRFIDKPTVVLLEANAETAAYFGRLKQQLEAIGRPLPINDVWIAAHALQSASTLATFDLHFQHIIGLPLYSFE
jgi:tRNA(fMet)-specific endonuclease VapC